MTVPSFGVNLGRLDDAAGSGGVPAGPVAAATWAEHSGLDVVTAADHLGAPSPFVQLAAAAAVTTRVRLRTYVLDFGFWNPVLLARDVATLDAISAGRVDLGLGAGHLPREHARAGLPFPSYADRLDALDAFARRVRDVLDEDDHRPAPVQRPVPLFVAAMSRRGLSVAARHGEVVGLAGVAQVAGAPAGTFTLATSAQTDERVHQVQHERAGRGLPPARFDLLLQQVVLDPDPERVAAGICAELDGRLTVAQALDTPFLLLAEDERAAAREIRRRTERWGVSSWCAHTPSGPALAQVARAVRSVAAGSGR